MDKKVRKQREDVNIEEYLQLCQDKLQKEEYFEFEKSRVKSLFKMDALDWIQIIENQNSKCYYCQTDIRVIQQLIFNKVIKPRKRGPDSYSGLHFELDHKNANKDDNGLENIVASCYYCNNDKSNTFSSEIFKKYFGAMKNQAFLKLFDDEKLITVEYFIHHLKGKIKS